MSRIAALTRNPAMIALFVGLAVAGCASKKAPNSAADLGLGAGAATPGSAQDFTVNVGDRIFFDTDSSAIRADAQQTLSKQAQWLNKYGNYAITVEGHADGAVLLAQLAAALGALGERRFRERLHGVEAVSARLAGIGIGGHGGSSGRVSGSRRRR